MDANMKGRVLTAHGAGDEWTKTCGLGQGSVLAPLKWNLFLDPLLNRLQTTRDPYVCGLFYFNSLRLLRSGTQIEIYTVVN
jgi:hypothetical protein